MNEFQHENEKLRQENSELRDKAHHAQMATKMVIFLAACGVVPLKGVSPSQLGPLASLLSISCSCTETCEQAGFKRASCAVVSAF